MEGHERVVASALHDTHDHHILVDILGLIASVAVAVLFAAATLLAVGMVLLRWVQALGG